MADLLQTRVEAIRRLARRRAHAALQRALEKSHAEDIAAAMSHLAPGEQRFLMSEIANDAIASQVLASVDEHDLKILSQSLPFERLVCLLEAMDPDDEADVISCLPKDLREQVMAAITGEDKAHIEEILAWPEDSAGGIMSPLAFRLNEDLTCRDAIAALQDADDLEMVFYIYVENESGQLVGVTSLRNLLTNSPSLKLSEVMSSDVITVEPHTDQEEVARIVSHYDLLAVPVVDERRNLLGIVTIDDVVDVIKEEAVEDMLLMAGMGDGEAPHTGSVFQSARQRFLWLLVTLFGGIGMAMVIGLFEGTLAKAPVLAGFIPVMMGTGGNVGIQAATIAVRNIAIGHVATGMLLIFREARVGLLLGLGFAIALGAYTLLSDSGGVDRVQLATAIATAIIVTTTCAAVFGALVPVTLNRLGTDPAIATGPFVTTGIDVVAILIYFGTCKAILAL
ncbi:MAG: magnesium transporter [Myxococcota bacterium]|nr:magnesium transporter [Myxococcota bacterium]